MRAHACRCAGPRCSASASSPVAACHSPMRSAGARHRHPPDGKGFTLPLEAAVGSRGDQHRPVPAGNLLQPPALARSELRADHGDRRRQPQPRAETRRADRRRERAARAPRCCADFGGHGFRLAWMAAAHDDPRGARRDSARARLAAASRRLGGNGGGSGMPTRRPGHERTGGSASASTIGCGTISERSGMERDSLSACSSPLERAAPAASAVSRCRVAEALVPGSRPVRPAGGRRRRASATMRAPGPPSHRSRRRSSRQPPVFPRGSGRSSAASAASRRSSGRRVLQPRGKRGREVVEPRLAALALRSEPVRLRRVVRPPGRLVRARRTPARPASSRPRRLERSVPWPIPVMEGHDSTEPRHPSGIDVEPGAPDPHVGGVQPEEDVDVCGCDRKARRPQDQRREPDAGVAAQIAAAGGEPAAVATSPSRRAWRRKRRPRSRQLAGRAPSSP